MNQTVTITIGIPASGKTTWARKQTRNNANILIVSRDDIRHAHNWKSGFDEDRVTQIHCNQIEVALLDGYDVIVADTNINPHFRKKLIKFCHEHGADVQIKRFDISLDEAILRDAARTEHQVGADVVTKFYNDLQNQPNLKDEFLPCPRYAPYEHKSKLGDFGYGAQNRAVVVDIDGTLAHMVTRGPYDEDRVMEDDFDTAVAGAVQGMADAMNADVIVVSGRTDKSRELTADWLDMHNFKYERLIMRKHGDRRPDYVVKNEIYDTEIIPLYDVLAAFDDRDQVVRHVRARGIKVFQVAPGRF